MKALYDQMWQEARAEFAAHRFEIDPMIDDPADSRRGLSVVFSPENEALEGLSRVQQELRKIAPEQYYATTEELHVTVLSLISCANGVHLNDIDVKRFTQVLESSLYAVAPFEVNFQGLTASPSCVMAQGFTQAGILERLRASLQQGIIEAALPHTIGRRYPARTAHCTLLRFRQAPSAPDRLVEQLALLRDRSMGRCRIPRVSLVFNDWYHRTAVVRELHVVELE